MAVLEPLKVTIRNFPTDAPAEIEVPDFPAEETKGSHRVPFEQTLYIEQSDFREVGSISLSRSGVVSGVISDVKPWYGYCMKCSHTNSLWGGSVVGRTSTKMGSNRLCASCEMYALSVNSGIMLLIC